MRKVLIVVMLLGPSVSHTASTENQFFEQTLSSNAKTIVLQELAGIARKSWPIVIPISTIFQDAAAISQDTLRLEDEQGRPIPYQVDRLSRCAEDCELAFLVDLEAGQRRELRLRSYPAGTAPKSPAFKTDIRVTNQDGRVVVENSNFVLELTDAENAELRLKTNDGLGESWQSRIWTWAGAGHTAPLHDGHYRNRRLLNEVKSCEVISSGPVRAVIRLYYDFVHFEENLDVERTLIIYSNRPVIEKISTSMSGEGGIILATMLSKLGPLTVADGAYCGGSSFPVNYPRIFPTQVGRIPFIFDWDMNFECISTQFNPTYLSAASYRTIKDIDGLTWGAVWNPASGQGKAEIAGIEDVKGYFTGWEQDRVSSRWHPRTDRVFGDFLFGCTSKRTFRHYSIFFNSNSDDKNPSKWLDSLTKSLANPISVTVDSTAKPAERRKPDEKRKQQKTQKDIDKSAAQISETHPVPPKSPELHFKDFCSMLSRPEKRTLHGNLLRYWAGQPDVYWKELEPETLGFTHAWYFDGKSWGSFPDRDWEFWRKERTAYGSFHDHKRSTIVTSPKALETRWEPGRLYLKYDLDGVKISETKFLYNDVLADRIELTNTRGEEAHFTISFTGKGHGASDAFYDAEKEAIIIKEHAYAYTGLNKIFHSSIPFTSWSFEPTSPKETEYKQAKSLPSNLHSYGEPVWYTFCYEFKLKPGQERQFTLAFTIDKDTQQGYAKVRKVAAEPSQAIQSLRRHWNHWLNYEVPRFESDDDLLNQLYYYLWFVYRCNLIDAAKGWYKYPYVAPTSATYFMTQFGWDSAFHAMIGKWLAHPEKYAYGNLLNWTLVQAPCGFLPEFFGQDWRTTWGHRLSLLASALYQTYQKTGDLDLVKKMYPTLKKSEKWQACEIDYSPYWDKYHRNIVDFQKRKDAFAAGKLWFTGDLDYYEKFAFLAKLVGDERYYENLTRKALLSKEKMLGSRVCTDKPIPIAEIDHRFGSHEMYWASRLVNPERIKEVLTAISDPDKFLITFPPGSNLSRKISGDGWDHGGSITTQFFFNEGLFKIGLIEEALKLLFDQIDASFIETSEGLRPTAPEYWDVKGRPWGCIEYSWNGLLNMLLIERVCGIQPDLPHERIVLAPNLPAHLNFVEVTVPFGAEWTTFRTEVNRSAAFTRTTTVKNAPANVIVRFRTPRTMRLESVMLDDAPAEYNQLPDAIEIDTNGKKDFTLTAKYIKK